MTDIVLTVPRAQWAAWSAVGHRGGAVRGFHVYGPRPPVSAGDRLYVLAFRRIRYQLEILAMVPLRGGHFIQAAMVGPRTIVTGGDVVGFKGWRAKWWDDGAERSYPEWRTEGVYEVEGAA